MWSHLSVYKNGSQRLHRETGSRMAAVSFLQPKIACDKKLRHITYQQKCSFKWRTNQRDTGAKQTDGLQLVMEAKNTQKIYGKC